VRPRHPLTLNAANSRAPSIRCPDLEHPASLSLVVYTGGAYVCSRPLVPVVSLAGYRNAEYLLILHAVVCPPSSG